MVLHIQGMLVVTRIQSEIKRVVNTLEIRQYYREKHRWRDEVLETIDWEDQEKAMALFTKTNRQ